MKSVIKPFQEAVDGRGERLRALAAGGRTLVGYFCTYAPVEVVYAAGILPVRVMGLGGPVTRADAVMPNFICPYLRLAMESGLAGDYDYLSGLVQGYTCDAACGLTGIWKENVGGRLFHTVPWPYNHTPEARRYFRAVIGELEEKLEGLGGSVTAESLEHSVRLYEGIRGLLADLYEKRSRGELALSAADLLTVVQAGFVTPPEEYRRMLGSLPGAALSPNGVDKSGVPVLVSGSVVEDPAVLELIESCGAKVVADDLCTGLRFFQPPAGEGPDPVSRLMDRLKNRFPCPTRGRAEQRAPLILDLAARAGARGVVFLFQKFCTPHLADYPFLKNTLADKGLPSVMIELEEGGIGQGQFRTRLEGFVEILKQ